MSKVTLNQTTADIVTVNLPAGEAFCSLPGAMCWMTSNIEMVSIKSAALNLSIAKLVLAKNINQYKSHMDQGVLALSPLQINMMLRTVDCNDEAMQVKAESLLGWSSELKMTAGSSFTFGGGLDKKNIDFLEVQGNGAFVVQSNGTTAQIDLTAEQEILVDEKSLVAYSEKLTVTKYKIVQLNTALFAGEGFALFKVSGAGRVIVSSN